ncbi:phospholipase A2 inhibitor gamma subunit B-like [Anolis sagrei]|uniref:phospholipase A2 inhibitor gamma subunit B-like n=1 Tax=Anolis sagrei TaxID=38937 RepID=UPI003520BD56
MPPQNMENLMMMSILATFIAAGSSLECEICQAHASHSCVGRMETCPPAFDRCGTLLTEADLGVPMKGIMKMCMKSHLCDSKTVINMGQAGIASNQISCCMENECKRFTPTLTPMDKTPNGLVCPGCLQWNRFECRVEEQVHCTGEQNKCFTVSGTSTHGETNFPLTMKGCTNSAECDRLIDHSDTVTGFSLIMSLNCTPAPGNHVSKTARNISDLYGVFFSILAALLLVKIFI